MEINNILDALDFEEDGEIVQICDCSYKGKSVEFRLIIDDIGVIDDIEFNNDGTWSDEYLDVDSDEDIAMIVDAIENAPFNVFHKSDVGATLKLNHESIKEQNVPEHFKMGFYVDEDGPIHFSLKKNIFNPE